MKKRLHELDVLRVTATFAVMAIHVSSAYVLTSPGAFTVNQMVRFAVPLFLIVSGFSLSYTDSSESWQGTGSFLSRRFTRILWPYLIWSLIYFLLGLYYNGSAFNIKELGYHLIWGTASYHLYFMIVIAQLYILYPLLRRVSLKKPLTCLIIAFFLTLICQSALYLHALGLIKLPFAYSNLYLVAFPIWIFYFQLGITTAVYIQYIGWLKENLSLLLPAWMFSLLLLAVDGHFTNTFWSSMKPTVICYTIASYFTFLSLALRIKGKGYNCTTWLSEESFLIYLMHPLCLHLLICLPGVPWIPITWGGFTGMILLYGFTVLLTLAAVYIISISPWAVYLGGKTVRNY